MSEEELKLIGDCLGVNIYHAIKSKLKKDKKLPKEFYRNYFCLQDLKSYNEYNFREPYYTLFMNLTLKGYTDSFDKFGNKIFYVTDLGIEEFKKEFKIQVKCN